MGETTIDEGELQEMYKTFSEIINDLNFYIAEGNYDDWQHGFDILNGASDQLCSIAQTLFAELAREKHMTLQTGD
jgi:soluble cytochrome b562